MAYPEYIDPIEQQIIDVIVKKALAAGHTISVYGEGELDLKQSNDYEEITSHIAACDLTELIIHGVGKGLWVMLVHGNGCDVLVDYYAGDVYDEFLKEANDLAESLQ